MEKKKVMVFPRTGYPGLEHLSGVAWPLRLSAQGLQLTEDLKQGSAYSFFSSVLHFTAEH